MSGPRQSDIAAEILSAGITLARDLDALTFSVPYVYNSFDYAWDGWKQYVETWLSGRKEVILLGINPGPWGMAQTGVPFGEVEAVTEWLGLHPRIGKPSNEHPKRPILGVECPRSEVSGRRLWAYFRERYKTPDAFFARFGVLNYCPLAFMGETGRNITPDKLTKEERQPLFDLCDHHLIELLSLLSPETAVGVGRFAESVLKRLLTSTGGSKNVGVGSILHPSPASPAANLNWAERADLSLKNLLDRP